MADYGLLDLLRDRDRKKNLQATQRIARATEQQVAILQAQTRPTYEQGWHEGWTAGYAAAMEKIKETP